MSGRRFLCTLSLTLQTWLVTYLHESWQSTTSDMKSRTRKEINHALLTFIEESPNSTQMAKRHQQYYITTHARTALSLFWQLTFTSPRLHSQLSPRLDWISKEYWVHRKDGIDIYVSFPLCREWLWQKLMISLNEDLKNN